MDDLPPRKHGFEPPLDTFQYVAVFAYVLFTVSFCVLHAPLLTPSIWRYIVIGLFVVWIPVSIITYIIAAFSRCHPDALDDDPPMTYGEVIRTPEPPGKKACRECLVFVPESCKHCHACGKCVEGFDHHCRWLNHCVGERNYVEFAIFLGNTFVVLALQAALGWWLSIETAMDYSAFTRRATRAFHMESNSAVVALAFFMWFVAVLEFFVVLVLGQLFVLHIELNIRGISTWDLIQVKRSDSRARKAERAALGIPTPEGESPTCHAYVVWSRQRELASERDAADAHRSKYAQNDTPGYATTRTEEMSDRDAVSEPSIANSRRSSARTSAQGAPESPAAQYRRTSSAFAMSGGVPNTTERAQLQDEQLVPNLVQRATSEGMPSPTSAQPAGTAAVASANHFSSCSASDAEDAGETPSRTHHRRHPSGPRSHRYRATDDVDSPQAGERAALHAHPDV